MNHLFIVGAQRSGSTYLYRLLDDHPQVMLAKPVRPEPKFFLDDQLYARGREFYEVKYFSDLRSEIRWLGEKSTSYIESATAAKRIRDFYPDARVLIILRDPVERAWSNYRFSVQHGLEPLGFEAALDAETDRLSHGTVGTSVNPYAYRRRGQYIDYISEYLKVFGADHLCLLIFEELVANLANTQALYRSLDINDSFLPPSLGKAINASSDELKPPVGALRDLALGYRQSLKLLEDQLGRSIDIWRRHWETL